MPYGLDRRRLLLGAGGALVAGPALSAARTRPGLAVTLDDFDIADGPRLSGAERHAAILSSLERHRIRAAGFPAGKFVDNDPARRHLQTWSQRGHLIGNHSYSHSFYAGGSPERMMADILREEPLLSAFPTFRKWFRYPYLAEGKTAEGRDGLRRLLQANGYRNA
jgi:peptidoglycan/xylan/chitin deacetylase (PgdA/CDA1 family)